MRGMRLGAAHPPEGHVGAVTGATAPLDAEDHGRGLPSPEGEYDRSVRPGGRREGCLHLAVTSGVIVHRADEDVRLGCLRPPGHEVASAGLETRDHLGDSGFWRCHQPYRAPAAWA